MAVVSDVAQHTSNTFGGIVIPSGAYTSGKFGGIPSGATSHSWCV
jgi:hypothetical protein